MPSSLLPRRYLLAVEHRIQRRTKQSLGLLGARPAPGQGPPGAANATRVAARARRTSTSPPGLTTLGAPAPAPARPTRNCASRSTPSSCARPPTTLRARAAAAATPSRRPRDRSEGPPGVGAGAACRVKYLCECWCPAARISERERARPRAAEPHREAAAPLQLLICWPSASETGRKGGGGEGERGRSHLDNTGRRPNKGTSCVELEWTRKRILPVTVRVELGDSPTILLNQPRWKWPRQKGIALTEQVSNPEPPDSRWTLRIIHCGAARVRVEGLLVRKRRRQPWHWQRVTRIPAQSQ